MKGDYTDFSKAMVLIHGTGITLNPSAIEKHNPDLIPFFFSPHVTWKVSQDLVKTSPKMQREICLGANTHHKAQEIETGFNI